METSLTWERSVGARRVVEDEDARQITGDCRQVFGVAAIVHIAMLKGKKEREKEVRKIYFQGNRNYSTFTAHIKPEDRKNPVNQCSIWDEPLKYKTQSFSFDF